MGKATGLESLEKVRHFSVLKFKFNKFFLKSAGPMPIVTRHHFVSWTWSIPFTHLAMLPFVSAVMVMSPTPMVIANQFVILFSAINVKIQYLKFCHLELPVTVALWCVIHLAMFKTPISIPNAYLI